MEQLRHMCLEEKVGRDGPAGKGYNALTQSSKEWVLEPSKPCSGERLLLMFDRWYGNISKHLGRKDSHPCTLLLLINDICSGLSGQQAPSREPQELPLCQRCILLISDMRCGPLCKHSYARVIRRFAFCGQQLSCIFMHAVL